MNIKEAFESRRSINFFDNDKPVSEDTLKALLDVANYTPSSFNLQPWEVIAVTSPEKKELLKSLAFNQSKVEEASAVLIIIANPNAVEDNIERVLKSWIELGYMDKATAEKTGQMPFGLYGKPDSPERRSFAIKNAAFFAMSIMLAAKEFGLDTHPMDGIESEKIKEAFGISKEKSVPLILAVGYLQTGTILLPRAFRRSIDEFVTVV